MRPDSDPPLPGLSAQTAGLPAQAAGLSPQAAGLSAQAGGLSAQAVVNLEAEVPEVLFEGMRQYLAAHPQWDQVGLIRSALAGFLFQHGCKDACVNQHYLNGLFLR